MSSPSSAAVVCRDVNKANRTKLSSTVKGSRTENRDHYKSPVVYYFSAVVIFKNINKFHPSFFQLTNQHAKNLCCELKFHSASNPVL